MDNIIKKERWYDKDPQLRSIMKFLELSNEEVKVDIAMDIIQVIVQENYTDSDGLIEFAKTNYIGNAQRWYDTDDVVHTAIEMLKILDINERKAVLSEIAETIMYYSINKRNTDE